jgi:RimJ/RimL family protein N-acetyltransferase
VIFKLDENDFEKMLPLYLNKEVIFPLILSVIQKKQRGWVFVNNPVEPVSAIIVTKSGFMQLVGTENDKGFESDVFEFFKLPNPDLPTYLLWYLPSFQAQKKLDEYIPQYVRRRERVRFVFKNQIENLVQCRPGFSVRFLERDLIQKVEHFNLDIGSRFWSSIDDFLENGIGACVIKDDEIVSLCYSACIVNNLAEVDVVTQEEYRGMGLAVIAAQNFMSECVRRGITPTWDCFVNNVPSMRLAILLGYTKTVAYPFYSFNIPLDFSGKF